MMPIIVLLRGDFCQPWRFLLALANYVSYPDQHYGDRIKPARSQQDKHRRRHRWRHFETLLGKSGALVQTVPPLNREINYRDIDDTDQRQHGARAVGATSIVNRRL